MTAYQKAPSLEQTKEILTKYTKLVPQDKAYLHHPIIQRFGSPELPIYIDQMDKDIERQPLIFPIVNGNLSIIQYAVMLNNEKIELTCDGEFTETIAKGFTTFGDFSEDKPVIITRSIEEYFKIAQTGYAVVLVVLPHLCYAKSYQLKAFDFEQIRFVINQLSDAGYKYLYLPVRIEQSKLEAYQNIERNTSVQLLNQLHEFEGNQSFTDFNQCDAKEEVKAFLDEAISLLPMQKHNPLPKGHLAKPMKWCNGKFHIIENGIFYLDDSKEIAKSTFISSPVLVIAKTRDENSQNWGVLLKWNDASGTEHTQALSMELFQTDGADLRKTLAYRGVNIAPEFRSRSLFQSYLMSYEAEQKALCVDRVGWYENVFVLPHKPIGKLTNRELIVYQSNNSLDNRYQSKGSLVQWQCEVAQAVKSHSLLVFSLCTAFAGQLLSPLNQQGGGFHIKGASSKGKSTALNLACSVWGNPKHFYRTWRATGNALEHTAYMHNDSFLVLDEIGEIANPKEIGTIVYMLANGSGKGRMDKQITAKPMLQWKVIFLSSGEKSLDEIMQEQGQKTKLGQNIRLVDIDIDQSEFGIFDCLDFAKNSANQAIELQKRIADNYGVAGIAWLEYLTANKHQVIHIAQQLLEEYRNQLIGDQTEGHILRVANYFALVATAGEIASRANITGWMSGHSFNAVRKIYEQWLGSFKHVGDYENREILMHVKSFFEANETSRFESVTPDVQHAERINNRVGYWKIVADIKIFYVLGEQFKNEVCKGYDSRKVAKVLLDSNFLDHDTGKTTKTTRLPCRSTPLRVYAIKESILGYEPD